MKRLILPALASIILASCAREPAPMFEQESLPAGDNELVTISFCSKITSEPMTKATTSIADLSNRLDVYIVCGEDMMEFHQNKTEDEDFGTIAASLNKTKSYTIYAIAHKGSGPATLDEEVFSFADNKITETLYCKMTFSPSITTELSCSMSRIVGMFKLVILDALPENLAKVRFTVSDTYLGYGVEGTLEDQGDKVSVINNPSSAQDGSTTFKVYCLAGSEMAPFDITVTALDADDEVIEERTFEDVSLQAGYMTTYRGTFFVTTSMSLSFSCSDEWSNFEEESY